MYTFLTHLGTSIFTQNKWRFLRHAPTFVNRLLNSLLALFISINLQRYLLIHLYKYQILLKRQTKFFTEIKRFWKLSRTWNQEDNISIFFRFANVNFDLGGLHTSSYLSHLSVLVFPSNLHRPVSKSLMIQNVAHFLLQFLVSYMEAVCIYDTSILLLFLEMVSQ